MDAIYRPVSEGIQKVTDGATSIFDKIYELLGGGFDGAHKLLGGVSDEYYFDELPSEVAGNAMAQKIVEKAREYSNFETETYSAVSGAYSELYAEARKTKGQDYIDLNTLRLKGGAHSIYLGVIYGQYSKAETSEPDTGEVENYLNQLGNYNQVAAEA
ncbi:MAG: hypothetical protein GOU98_00785 [Candidatus Altiarchaeota archaeon]|nr:hypothetical protein [Candidatus Altiarchaeota archaeon]